MFEIEFVCKKSGLTIHKRVRGAKLANRIARQIVQGQSDRVIVRKIEGKFDVWLWVPDQNRFVLVGGKPVDRLAGAQFWLNWSHVERSAVAVLWPVDTPPPSCFVANS
jgi:hypothetical protein